MTAIKHLLIVINKFSIGGRETYIEEYVRELKRRGVLNVYLLAARIEAVPSDIFTDTAQVLTDTRSFSEIRLSEWRYCAKGLGDKHLEPDSTFDCIWVHHYEVLPALYLSQYLRSPIKITLHGSLLAQGVLDRFSAVALARAIYKGLPLGAVSKEIAEQLGAVTSAFDVPKAKVSYEPNLIKVDAVNSYGAAEGNAHISEFRFLMLSRRQKLEHLRAGVLLFSEIYHRHKKVSLDIYTQKNKADLENQKKQIDLARLLGRRWILLNPRVWLSLKRITVFAATHTPSSAVKNAHAVLGMGRVVIEAIAARRIAVLISYQQAVARIKMSNFSSMQFSNFSGRGMPVDTPDKIAIDVISVLQKRAQEIFAGNKAGQVVGAELDDLAQRVDIAGSAVNIFSSVFESSTPKIDCLAEAEMRVDNQSKLIKKMIESASSDELQIVRQICPIKK